MNFLSKIISSGLVLLSLRREWKSPRRTLSRLFSAPSSKSVNDYLGYTIAQENLQQTAESLISETQLEGAPISKFPLKSEEKKLLEVTRQYAKADRLYNTFSTRADQDFNEYDCHLSNRASALVTSIEGRISELSLGVFSGMLKNILLLRGLFKEEVPLDVEAEAVDLIKRVYEGENLEDWQRQKATDFMETDTGIWRDELINETKILECLEVPNGKGGLKLNRTVYKALSSLLPESEKRLLDEIIEEYSLRH